MLEAFAPVTWVKTVLSVKNTSVKNIFCSGIIDIGNLTMAASENLIKDCLLDNFFFSVFKLGEICFHDESYKDLINFTLCSLSFSTSYLSSSMHQILPEFWEVLFLSDHVKCFMLLSPLTKMSALKRLSLFHLGSWTVKPHPQSVSMIHFTSLLRI